MTTQILIKNGDVNDYSVITDDGLHVAYTQTIDYTNGHPTITKGPLTIQEYLESKNCNDYEIVDILTFMDRQEQWHSEQYLTPAVSVTEEQFYDMLEVLPPMNWVRNGPIETFMMMEYICGDITAQYGRVGSNYICKNVIVGDPSTHIKREDFYNKNLDERNLAILQESEANYNKKYGPRIGDYVEMLNGSMQIFSHDYEWCDDIQTAFSGSIHLSTNGYASFSGGLEPSIKKSNLVDTGRLEYARFWFFNHGYMRAHGGIDVFIKVRVYKQLA